MTTCECTYDPEFHTTKNGWMGRPDDSTCHNDTADHSPAVASPALCTPCLFGCAP